MTLRRRIFGPPQVGGRGCPPANDPGSRNTGRTAARTRDTFPRGSVPPIFFLPFRYWNPGGTTGRDAGDPLDERFIAAFSGCLPPIFFSPPTACVRMDGSFLVPRTRNEREERSISMESGANWKMKIEENGRLNKNVAANFSDPKTRSIHLGTRRLRHFWYPPLLFRSMGSITYQSPTGDSTFSYGVFSTIASLPFIRNYKNWASRFINIL